MTMDEGGFSSFKFQFEITDLRFERKLDSRLRGNDGWGGFFFSGGLRRPAKSLVGPLGLFLIFKFQFENINLRLERGLVKYVQI